MADAPHFRLVGQANNGEFLQTVVLTPGVGGIGLGGEDVGLSLGNLLGPAAVFQLQVDFPLGIAQRFHVGDLRLQPAFIQLRQQLSLVYCVPFDDFHFDDTFVVVESELNLPQIDIAIKNQFVRVGGMIMVVPPPGRPRPGANQNKQNDDEQRSPHALPSKRKSIHRQTDPDARLSPLRMAHPTSSSNWQTLSLAKSR